MSMPISGKPGSITSWLRIIEKDWGREMGNTELWILYLGDQETILVVSTFATVLNILFWRAENKN